MYVCIFVSIYGMNDMYVSIYGMNDMYVSIYGMSVMYRCMRVKKECIHIYGLTWDFKPSSCVCQHQFGGEQNKGLRTRSTGGMLLPYVPKGTG